MLSAYGFMAINLAGYLLALAAGPFWGLIAYGNVYFNAQNPKINWWAAYLPFTRWSLLTFVIVLVSIGIHRGKLSKCTLRSLRWFIAFIILTYLITYSVASFPEVSKEYAYILLTFFITAFCIIKGINSQKKYRAFLLLTIIWAAKLSLDAYLHGKRIHGRLENIGTADTLGSNEFGLLLCGILPFLLPFLFNGRWYERVLCILCLPFMINAFILCNSRSAFVALIVSLLAMPFFLPPKMIRRRILFCILLAIPVFLYLADQHFVERMASLWETETAMQSQESINTLSSGRTDIWRYGLQMVKDYPLGAGPGGFSELARFYMPEEILTFHPGKKYGVRAAHNTLLQILVEQGILGLLIFVGLCVHTLLLLRSAFKKIHKILKSEPFLGMALFSTTYSLLTILVGGMFNSRIYYEFMFWQLAFAIIVSYLVNQASEDLAQTAPVHEDTIAP